MEAMECDEGPKKTVASTILFYDLCRFFEKINKCRIKQKRVALLCKYVSNFRELYNSIHGQNFNSGDSFFPILRLIVPNLDRARGPYGVKEHTLARIYVRILCLPKDGPDASKLKNYRVPKFAGKMAGDFADVSYMVLTSRCTQSPSRLSIEEVNKHLDNIAKHHNDHEPRLIDKELTELLRVMSAMEQKWLIRILLKGISIGLGHTSIFNALHPDARSLFDVRSDLDKVCKTFNDPSVKLEELEVEIFSHVRPMLAARTDPHKISVLLQSKNVVNPEVSTQTTENYLILETKLDGERFQLHYQDKEFKYFSHNGFDYTENFGKDKNSCGTLTSRIAPLIKSHVRNVILDGHSFDVKKMKSSEAFKDGIEANRRYEPCFCVFDILYLNGQVLTGRPVKERIPILKTVFTSEEGIFVYAPVNQIVKSKEEIVDALNRAIDDREEGIMLKEPASVYKPHDRNGGWYKIKPEYIGEVSDTLDLLILGGFYGEGRRKGIISHFLLGIACPPPFPGARPREFHSIGRVGSGFTFDELEELLSKLKHYWKEVKLVDDAHENAGIIWTKERPDVWIHPHNSCVLKIRATEIVKCDAFKTGYTLRFPRVESVRYDKSWYECMNTTEVTHLRQLGSGKLYTRHMGEDDKSVIKRQKAENRRGAVLGEQFKGKEVSSVLEGQEICVLNGDEEHTKQDLEKLIVKYGGRIAQNPGEGTFCVIVGDESPFRVKNIIRSGSFDVIRMSWILKVCSPDCPKINIDENRCPWSVDEIVGASPKTSKYLALHYDAYGDSFTQPVTVSSLKKLTESMNTKNCKAHTDVEDMEMMDIELFSGQSPFSIFRGCVGLFHQDEEYSEMLISSSSLHIFKGKSDFCFFSGTVARKINERTSHVIVESRESKSIPELMRKNHSREKKFYLVTLDWIVKSCEKRKRLNELHFHPNSPDLQELEDTKNVGSLMQI
ncbi:hypothetical protein J437_LFUL001094 [Ladona fulva]|uniref:DNA ligase 4 n=1 Tax=Ladona fulva TaxID=123851 RepID=A0A8K0NW98_LADFU|nr:hypothetical protein J437_LFUL001094 [Ladona fulva]